MESRRLTRQEILDHADELQRAVEAYEPTDADRLPDTPEMALRRAAYHRAEAERDDADDRAAPPSA